MQVSISLRKFTDLHFTGRPRRPRQFERSGGPPNDLEGKSAREMLKYLSKP